jgi:hypothetical protein
MKKVILVLVLMLIVNIGYSQKVSLLNFNDTCAVSIDTASRHYLSTSNTLKDKFAQNYYMTVWADDSLEFADNISFTNSWVILPNMSYTTPKPLNVNFQPRIYFRRKGTDGTVNFFGYFIGD